MKASQILHAGQKKIAVCLIRAILLVSFVLPFTVNGQEAGCFDVDTLYVKINTIPQVINASAANFSVCNGSYSYQWQISTDDKYFIDIPGATGEDFNYTQPVVSTLYFLRKATCGSLIRYTNSIMVYPVYKACSDFSLSLSGTSGNALASIKAGMITSATSSTIGEFVVEWYREKIDGTPEFVSGSAGATDTTVTVTHPFSGEPAEGGTWYPVIKYAYINGIKYSRNYMAGARHSPDLLHCLDSVVVRVNNLSCSNGGSINSNGATYAHLVSYRNKINSIIQAKRSFRFELDATNRYFAWKFAGFEIADTLKISYVSPLNGDTGTVLEYWKVGSNGSLLNTTTNPKSSFFQDMAKITPLTAFTYAAGDYLKIEILPNANSNTDWDFYCICKSSPTCDAPTSAIRNIDSGSVHMIFDTLNCRYEVQYTVTNPYTGNFSSDFWQYHMKYNGGDMTSKVRKLQMNKRTDGSISTIPTYNIGTCAPMAGSAQVSKVGNVVTLIFNNNADYNSYKTNYNNALLNSNVSNYSSSPTVIEYYKFWIIDITIANSCGDATERHQIWSHLGNPINFNDANLTITTTINTIPTNAYVPSPNCDFIGTMTASMAGNNNIYAGNSTNFSGTTYVKGGIGCYYAIPISRNDTNTLFKSYWGFPSVDICELSNKGWVFKSSGWEFIIMDERVVITDGSDPIRNFRLERWVDANGNELSSNPIIIYKIENGVVKVNRGFPN